MLPVFVSGRKRVSVAVPFSLRVRLGQCEVEISGSRDEVLRTIEDLPNLVTLISEAFSRAEVDAPLNEAADQPVSSTVQPSSALVTTAYPSIQSSGGCADAVLRLLGTEWGRVAPRTLPEIIEAMRANAVHYPATTLSGVLNWLVRKGKVKRWKTDKGYVYVLAQASAPLEETQAQTETIEAPTQGG